MYYFKDYSELYSGLRRVLLDESNEVDSRVAKTKELQAVSFLLTNPRNRLAHHPDRKFNLPFAIFEFISDVTGANDVNLTKAINKKAADYSDDGYTFYGNYGIRIAPNLDRVIEKLRKDKDTRQAVISIYNTKDMFVKTKDVPCTLTLQFLIRDEKLNMIASMRSNDFFWGLQYDLFRFTLLHELVANELEIPLGWYCHFDGSLHVYDYHWEMLEKITNMESVNMPVYPDLRRQTCFDILNDLYYYIKTGEEYVYDSHDFSRVLGYKLTKGVILYDELPKWSKKFIKV